MIIDEHTDFSLSSAIMHFKVCQVCPIKQDKTAGGLGSEEEEEGVDGGVHGVELRSGKREREREREVARRVRALMHSLCAGRVLLQNTHSHKHIRTLRAPCAPVRGQLADRVLTSISAAHS